LASNRVKNHNLMAQYYPEVHYSEWAWIGHHYDVILDNSGTVERLSKMVDEILNSFYNNGVETNEVLNYETF